MSSRQCCLWVSVVYLTRNVNNISMAAWYSRARSMLEKCVNERPHHWYGHQTMAQQVKLLSKFLAKQNVKMEQDDF